MSWIQLHDSIYAHDPDSPDEIVNVAELQTEVDNYQTEIDSLNAQRKSTGGKEETDIEAIEFWNKQNIDAKILDFQLEQHELQNKLNEILNAN